MKAYRAHELNGPGGLRLEDLPDPVPGPGQVLLKLRAVSLNFRDLLMCFAQLPRSPHVQGTL
jgi:NADPH2:quinone reductase